MIKELGQEKTVILSTHIMQEVQATCDRVLIINKGNIVADGTPEELQRQFKGEESIKLELKIPQDTNFEDILWEKFPKLQSINSEKMDDENLWRVSLELEKDVDIREELFNLIVKQGWIIREMRTERISLEHIFRELTQN